VGVGPREVEVELVGVHFGEEVAAAREVFQIEELEELGFDVRRSFLGLLMTSAGTFEQSGRAALLEAAQPLTDGRHRGDEQPRGGLDAAVWRSPRAADDGCRRSSSHAPDRNSGRK
jgi:hypothetical protein